MREQQLLSEAQIRAHLKRILASPQFASSERQSALLRFIVDTTLIGAPEGLKESVIAVSVYGRERDYDPQINSAVRVDVGRLRQRLREFYDGPGTGEPIRIVIPKGSYVSQFELKVAQRVGGMSDTATRRRVLWVGGLAALAGTSGWTRLRGSSLKISVEPVAELSGRVAHQAVALAVALGHNGLDVHASWDDAWRPGVRMVVGAGAENEKRYVVALCYTDLYEFPTLSRHLEFRDAADLEARAGETGKAIRRAATEAAGLASGHRTGERKQSIETCRQAWRLRAGEPDFTLRRDDPTPPLAQLLDMLKRLEQSAARDPSFGCTHAELAWVYRLAAEHDARLFPKSRAEAELAVCLDPNLGLSQFVLGYVRFFWDWKFRDAYTCWLPAVLSQPFRVQWYRYFGDAAMIVGEYGAAEREFERGLALLPNSPVLLASRARLEFHRRDFAAMEKRARKLVALNPELHTGHVLVARALTFQGHPREAQEQLRLAPASESAGVLSALAKVRAHLGDRHGAESLIQKPPLAKSPSIAGSVYAILGADRQAEECFARALESKDSNLPYLLAEPDPALDGNAWIQRTGKLLGVKRG